MATTILQPFTQDYAREIASHLPDWQQTIDAENPNDYSNNRRIRLSYIGSDPDLQGASVEGFSRSRPAADSVEWRCNMHARNGNGWKYLVEALSYDARKAWPGSSVNIGLSKTPARVARELESRLLSYYLPAYRAAMQALRAEEQRKSDDHTLAVELAQILGCKVDTYPRHSSDGMPALYKGKLWPLYISYGVAHMETRSSVSLSPEQARELCMLVAKWSAEDGQ